jgi:hypothetical protein
MPVNGSFNVPHQSGGKPFRLVQSCLSKEVRMPLPARPAGHHAAAPSADPLAGPLRVSAAAGGRGRARDRPPGIAMSALAAGESVLSGLRQNQAATASTLALSDGTQISFSRFTEDSSLEPA